MIVDQVEGLRNKLIILKCINTENIFQFDLGTQSKMHVIPENTLIIQGQNAAGDTVVFCGDPLIGFEDKTR
ncbi:hypothetical protein D3C81_2044120 [compost metagenome]